MNFCYIKLHIPEIENTECIIQRTGCRLVTTCQCGYYLEVCETHAYSVLFISGRRWEFIDVLEAHIDNWKGSSTYLLMAANLLKIIIKD